MKTDLLSNPSQTCLSASSAIWTKKTMIMSMICLWTLIGQAVVMVSSDLVDPLETMKPEVQKEIVDAANKCRREVQPSASNMAMLEWSEEARATALKYAQVCSLDHSQLSERVLPSELQCGENMMFASNNISWTSIINAFCNEKKDFTYDVGPNSKDAKTGHYTQLVWAQSFKMGCACANCPNQPVFKVICVCHQCPPGNFMNQINTPYRKGLPCAECKNNCNNGLCTNPCPYNPDAIGCEKYKDNCNLDLVKNMCPRICGCTNNELI